MSGKFFGRERKFIVTEYHYHHPTLIDSTAGVWNLQNNNSGDVGFTSMMMGRIGEVFDFCVYKIQIFVRFPQVDIEESGTTT